MNDPKPCGWCGGWHQGTCPRVKALEYFPNGTLRRVEFHGEDGQGAAVPKVPKPPAPPGTSAVFTVYTPQAATFRGPGTAAG